MVDNPSKRGILDGEQIWHNILGGGIEIISWNFGALCRKGVVEVSQNFFWYKHVACGGLMKKKMKEKTMITIYSFNPLK